MAPFPEDDAPHVPPPPVAGLPCDGRDHSVRALLRCRHVLKTAVLAHLDTDAEMVLMLRDLSPRYVKAQAGALLDRLDLRQLEVMLRQDRANAQAELMRHLMLIGPLPITDPFLALPDIYERFEPCSGNGEKIVEVFPVRAGLKTAKQRPVEKALNAGDAGIAEPNGAASANLGDQVTDQDGQRSDQRIGVGIPVSGWELERRLAVSNADRDHADELASMLSPRQPGLAQALEDWSAARLRGDDQAMRAAVEGLVMARFRWSPNETLRRGQLDGSWIEAPRAAVLVD